MVYMGWDKIEYTGWIRRLMIPNCSLFEWDAMSSEQLLRILDMYSNKTVYQDLVTSLRRRVIGSEYSSGITNVGIWSLVLNITLTADAFMDIKRLFCMTEPNA